MSLEDIFWIRQVIVIHWSLPSEKIEKRQMTIIQRSLKKKYHVHVVVIFILLIGKFQETYGVIQRSLSVV